MDFEGRITITTEDGKFFHGWSASELVRALADDMWGPETNEEYMQGVSHRCGVWRTGARVRVDDECLFIADIMREGVVIMAVRDGLELEPEDFERMVDGR